MILARSSSRMPINELVRGFHLIYLAMRLITDLSSHCLVNPRAVLSQVALMSAVSVSINSFEGIWITRAYSRYRLEQYSYSTSYDLRTR